MGNKYTNNYEPKEYLDNIKKHQYKPSEFDELMKKLELLYLAQKFYLKFDENNNINNNIKQCFLKKYGLFLGIKRFFIPIIGVINSGKSTFMNNFLNLKNFLQMGDETTTRFICIIRHDKNAEIPEVYNVEIQKRNEYGYNFKEKGENLLKFGQNNNISKKIENINDDIRKNENTEKYITNPENYFLIIKTKIPIFEGEFEEYGNLIDFLDIPGLDEIKNNGNNIFDNFIQIIFSNILLPLFIFDIKSFEEDSSKNILIKYFDYYFSIMNNFNFKKNMLFNDGIFLLNKIDLLNEDIKDIISKFEKNYSEIILSNGKKLKIFLKYSSNYFGISALKFSNNKNSFFDNLLEDIIKESKNTNLNSFKKYIKDYLKLKYKIDLRQANEEETKLNDELKIINCILKKKCKNFSNPQISLKEYTYLKYNIKISNQEKDKNKDILLNIKKIIKMKLDNFLNFDFEGLISNINKLELENKIKIFNNKKFDKNNFIINFNKKILNLFGEPINDNFCKIKEISEQVNEFKTFYINKRIRILFIGKISSGKTSLLNSIIGNNYYVLETNMKECTKCIFRIKYSNKISFCESKLVYNCFGNYFEDIEERREQNLDSIKEKIKNLNKESKFKYYTLYIPIEALENFERKEEIELIDIPGIKQSLIDEQKIDLKDLINLSDGFILSSNSINLDDESSHFIMSEIINDIKKRNDNFDFKTCLFNLNYIDEIEDDLIEGKIIKFKEKITGLLNNRIYIGNFRQRLNIKEKILSCDDIKVSYFSNKYYKQYQENIDNIKKLKFINKENSPQEIYEELIDDYEDFQKFLSDKINQDELNNKINIIKQKLLISNDNEYIIKIAKIIICILNNKKQIARYKISKADIFFKNFNNQIISSQNNNSENIYKKFIIYFILLLFKLYYINDLCLNEERIEEYKTNIEIKKQIIENEYNDIKKIITTKFSNKLKIIDKYKDYVISLISNNNKLSKEEIIDKIKSMGIENKINEQMKKLDNEIKKIQIDFYYFCLKKITELLNDLDSFQEVLDIISYNYSQKQGKEGIIISSISGGVFFTSTMGLAIATTADAIALSTFGIMTGGIAFFLGITITFIQYYQINKKNSKKIEDYFDKVKIHINTIEKKYIKSLETQKKKFLFELENSKNISLYEIRYLKKINFPEKLKNLINSFNC